MKKTKIFCSLVLVLGLLAPAVHAAYQPTEAEGKLVQEFTSAYRKMPLTVKYFPGSILSQIGSRKWPVEAVTRFINGQSTKKEREAWTDDDKKLFVLVAKFATGSLSEEEISAHLKTNKERENYDIVKKEYPKLKSANQGSGSSMFLYIMIGLGVYFFIMMRKKNKREKTEEQRVASGIVKGARVSSIGGIIGVVQRVSDDEILLLIDREKKVHMTFRKSAIRMLMDEKTDTPDTGNQETLPDELPDELPNEENKG